MPQNELPITDSPLFNISVKVTLVDFIDPSRRLLVAECDTIRAAIAVVQAMVAYDQKASQTILIEVNRVRNSNNLPTG